MQSVQLISIDPARNRRRWYTLHVQQDLFGGLWLVCRWGRVGQAGGAEAHVGVEDLRQAADRCDKIVQKKLRRGYRRVGLYCSNAAKAMQTGDL